MRGVILTCAILVTLPPLLGCVSAQEKEQLAKPVNCDTAEGDLRILQSEKDHVAERVVAGVTAIAPAGIVLGILTGTEGTKLKVAAGEYNEMIDKKMAEIKRTCGL